MLGTNAFALVGLRSTSCLEAARAAVVETSQAVSTYFVGILDTYG